MIEIITYIGFIFTGFILGTMTMYYLIAHLEDKYYEEK